MQPYAIILAILGLAATTQAACGAEGSYQVKCGSTCFSCSTAAECNDYAAGSPTC